MPIWEAPYKLRKARFGSKFGTPAWSIYDGRGYFTGMGVYRSCYRHNGRYSYTLQRDGVDLKVFKRLRDSVAWLNMSELERFVAAI